MIFLVYILVRGESEDDIVELTAEGAPDQKLREVAIQTLFDTR